MDMDFLEADAYKRERKRGKGLLLSFKMRKESVQKECDWIISLCMAKKFRQILNVFFWQPINLTFSLLEKFLCHKI